MGMVKYRLMRCPTSPPPPPQTNGDENFSYKYDMKIIQRHSQAFALHWIIAQAQPIVSLAIKMKFLVSDRSCACSDLQTILTYHNGYCE